MHKFRSFLGIILWLVIASGFVGSIYFKVHHASAATADELQQQIDDHTSTIEQLKKEIADYQNQLNETSQQAKSLQSAVANLDLNSKKLQVNIKLTQAQIDATNLHIEQLGNGISDKETQIDNNHQALGETVRDLNESDSQSLIENLLVYPDLSSFWQQVEVVQNIQSGIQSHIDTLRGLKKDLETNKTESEQERDNLIALKQQLSDQETAVELNKKQEADLLAQTKNKESNYQLLIASRKAKELQFEQELTQFEAQLKLIVNPSSYPTAGTSVLSWPLTPHRITQYFGKTDFSNAHTQLYSGQGHNGIDIAAPIGTPIQAALDGVVKGTGDTDTACPGASFGRWVLVEHPNGLSSLYAHLSLIKVAQGQHVSTGDTIGYSGMTGYATGPHLHFTVYATQGVEVISRKSAACRGATYTLPVADLKAYLNPLSYLPQ